MTWLVPLPVALPLLVAAVLVGLAPICRRWVADSLGILTALVVGLACAWLMFKSAHHTLVYWFGGWAPRGQVAIGISFVIDPLGAGLATCGRTYDLRADFFVALFRSRADLLSLLMLIFLAPWPLLSDG